jgi:hypothetical protein
MTKPENSQVSKLTSNRQDAEMLLKASRLMSQQTQALEDDKVDAIIEEAFRMIEEERQQSSPQPDN